MLEDIDALAKLIKPNQNNSSVFRGILALLNDAPDSEIISTGLSKVNADDIDDPDLRMKAELLLLRADEQQLAERWKLKPSQAPEINNVVPLNSKVIQAPSQNRHSISFDDVGGLENVKRQFRRKIINPFQDKSAIFKKFKRKAGGGVLMYGPPGCGKTMIARALATECKASFKEIKAAEILDRYVGVAEKQIAKAFDNARLNKPAILFFDEVEALAQKRQFDSSSNVNTVVSALLSEMDGFSENNEGILFLGATNVPWSLDAAFRRPGRFDRTIFVPPPDKTARTFILKKLLSDRPVATGLQLDLIVQKSVGYSGADLNALVETAIDCAIEESSDAENIAPISQKHFKEAFSEVKSSAGEWLAQANGFAEYANQSGLYDDLSDFLKKYAR